MYLFIKIINDIYTYLNLKHMKQNQIKWSLSSQYVKKENKNIKEENMYNVANILIFF